MNKAHEHYEDAKRIDLIFTNECSGEKRLVKIDADSRSSITFQPREFSRSRIEDTIPPSVSTRKESLIQQGFAIQDEELLEIRGRVE